MENIFGLFGSQSYLTDACSIVLKGGGEREEEAPFLFKCAPLVEEGGKRGLFCFPFWLFYSRFIRTDSAPAPKFHPAKNYLPPHIQTF